MMKKKTIRAVSLVVFGFLIDIAHGFQEESATKPVTPTDAASPTDPAAPDEKEASIVSEVCPRYRYMNWGSYYSYYAQRVSDCGAVTFNSTSPSLSSSGNCGTGGAGCYPAKMMNGLRVDRADDPGLLGYGNGEPIGGEGRKRGRLGRGPNNKPWPGQSDKLKVTHFDDFEINFMAPDGTTTLQAQVMVVEAEIIGAPETKAKLGRALEITRFMNPRNPVNGSVSIVSPISGRPYAYEFIYTPTTGSNLDPVTIEIITHHLTLGHTL